MADGSQLINVDGKRYLDASGRRLVAGATASNCGCCTPATPCCDGTFPDSVDVTLSGVDINNGGVTSCTSCGDIYETTSTGGTIAGPYTLAHDGNGIYTATVANPISTSVTKNGTMLHASFPTLYLWYSLQTPYQNLAIKAVNITISSRLAVYTYQDTVICGNDRIFAILFFQNGQCLSTCTETLAGRPNSLFSFSCNVQGRNGTATLDPSP